MKFLIATVIVLLQSRLVFALAPNDAAASPRIHSRHITKRAGRNCGTFTMFCAQAAGACNNACYHIHCVNSATATMVYDSTNSYDKNRVQSGCQTSDGNVCNKLPLSQVFHDPLNRTPGDFSITCDEWPMATIKQSNFVAGTVRNSLRCVNVNEESNGRAQLAAWLQGTNTKGPRKTCSGNVQDGDYWQITFDTTGTSNNAVQHCLNPSSCSGDPSAFHMTQLNGRLSFPYNVGADNQYAQDTVGKDLLQCSVTVKRQGHGGFIVTVFDPSGTRKGQQAQLLSLNGQHFLVTGLQQPLQFTRTTNYNASGGGMQFEYMSSPVFSWVGDTKGSSQQIASDGSYCTVSTVGEPDWTQDLQCYFPCPSA